MFGIDIKEGHHGDEHTWLGSCAEGTRNHGCFARSLYGDFCEPLRLRQVVRRHSEDDALVKNVRARLGRKGSSTVGRGLRESIDVF